MQDHEPVPTIVLDVSSVGERHIYDAWRESVREFYDVNPLSEHNGTTESVKAWLVDKLVFTDVVLSSQSFSHHSGHLKNASNYLSLQAYRSGVCRGITDDVAFEMLPGDVHIFDFSREFYSFADDSAVAGIVIPHEAIGYDPARHPPHFGFAKGSPVANLISMALHGVLENADRLPEQEAGKVCEGICGLLRGVLSLTPAEESGTLKSGMMRKRAMRSYLDNNLTDPDLGVDSLSRKFGVSIPTIYRDFADTGGVSHYIMSRRLDRAYSQLVSTPSRYGRIQDIAIRVGFEDPAYFSRLFRQRFGVPPSFAMKMNELEGPAVDSGRNCFSAPNLGSWFRSVAC